MEKSVRAIRRAGTGGNDDFRAAHFYTAAKIDNGAFGPELGGWQV